jgi:hypothetical protein
MTLSQREQRSLVLLGVAVAFSLTVWLWPSGTSASAPQDSPEQQARLLEQRLLKRRELAAALPAKEGVLKQAQAELASRESGILQADTPAQAQAQMLELFRRLGRKQTPPIDIKSTTVGQVRPLGNYYGEVVVSINFDCQIDQLVNLLADLTAQPEAIATSDLRVGAAAGREKNVPVQLTIAGVVPRRLVPEKKGPAF